MEAAALVALCTMLAHAGATQPFPPGVDCRSGDIPPVRISAKAAPADAAELTGLGARRLSALAVGDARDGIARVAFAEAGNQGDSGLAAVVYTILNRLDDGRWGGSIDAVLNAPHQFEPVMRAGGNWRNLRAVSEARQARIDTIINLALDGRLPDLTNGARFFQNPRIVADRAAVGRVPASLVNFGGAPPTAVIGAHTFYGEAGRGGGRARGLIATTRLHPGASDAVLRSAGGAIFVGGNKAQNDRGVSPDPGSDGSRTAASVAAPQSPSAGEVTATSGAMFVLPLAKGGTSWR